MRIYDALRERAAPLGPTQTAWDSRRDKDVPLSEFPDAARLAAIGEIPTIHVLLRGVGSCGVELPDLGVSITPGEVALDYRMGRDWDSDTLAAFIELLDELRRLDDRVGLAAAGELDLLPTSEQQRFEQAIDRYRNSGT